MPRHPEWFERIAAIEDAVREATETEVFGAQEIGAAFQLGYRESLRLLHKFGARVEADALRVSREALLAQLEAVRASTSYRSFLQKRSGIAQHLARAREESAARRLRVRPARAETERTRLEHLPRTLTWQRQAGLRSGTTMGPI